MTPRRSAPVRKRLCVSLAAFVRRARVDARSSSGRGLKNLRGSRCGWTFLVLVPVVLDVAAVAGICEAALPFCARTLVYSRDVCCCCCCCCLCNCMEKFGARGVGRLIC